MTANLSRRGTALLLLAAGACWQAAECDASLGRAIRRAAGVLDDVPAKRRPSAPRRSLDDVFEASARKASRYADRVPGRTPRPGGRLRSLDDLNLSPAQRRKAETLLAGAEDLKKAMPDAAARTDLLRRHGAAALEVAGLRKGGDDAARFADAYLRRADVRVPGRRAATMDDLAAVAADEGHWAFFKRHIESNYGKWAGGAAFSSFLLFPEQWHDAAGNVTEWGIRQAGELGGEVLAGAIRGSREAGTRIVEGVASEMSESLRPENVVGSLVGLPVVLGLAALLAVLLLAPLRRPALRAVKRLVVGDRPPDERSTPQS